MTIRVVSANNQGEILVRYWDDDGGFLGTDLIVEKDDEVKKKAKKKVSDGLNFNHIGWGEWVICFNNRK